MTILALCAQIRNAETAILGLLDCLRRGEVPPAEAADQIALSVANLSAMRVRCERNMQGSLSTERRARLRYEEREIVGGARDEARYGMAGA